MRSKLENVCRNKRRKKNLAVLGHCANRHIVRPWYNTPIYRNNIMLCIVTIYSAAAARRVYRNINTDGLFREAKRPRAIRSFGIQTNFVVVTCDSRGPTRAQTFFRRVIGREIDLPSAGGLVRSTFDDYVSPTHTHTHTLQLARPLQPRGVFVVIIYERPAA